MDMQDFKLSDTHVRCSCLVSRAVHHRCLMKLCLGRNECADQVCIEGGNKHLVEKESRSLLHCCILDLGHLN